MTGDTKARRAGQEREDWRQAASQGTEIRKFGEENA
jgi:hypothetical protein